MTNSPALELDYDAIAQQHTSEVWFCNDAAKAARVADPDCCIWRRTGARDLAHAQGSPFRAKRVDEIDPEHRTPVLMDELVKAVRHRKDGAWRADHWLEANETWTAAAELWAAAWARRSEQIRRDEHERRRRYLVSALTVPLDDDDRVLLAENTYDRSFPAIGLIREWAKAIEAGTQRKRILCLAGNTGVGKSFACAWALSRPWISGARDYVPMTRLAELANGYATRAEYRAIVGRRGFLVVDELDRAVKDSALFEREARAAMFDLLEERTGDGFHTILVTNRSEHEVLLRYSDATDDKPILDRWRKRVETVVVAGPSRRVGALPPQTVAGMSPALRRHFGQ